MARKVTIYKNNGGGHSLPSGRIVATGETFESDDAALATKFLYKFTKVSERDVDDTPATATPATVQEVPVPVASAPVAVDTAERVEGAGGADNGKADDTDVTAEFPEAVSNDLTVTKDAAGYWVRDEGEPTHDSALRTKTEVKKEIKNYTK